MTSYTLDRSVSQKYHTSRFITGYIFEDILILFLGGGKRWGTIFRTEWCKNFEHSPTISLFFFRLQR